MMRGIKTRNKFGSVRLYAAVIVAVLLAIVAAAVLIARPETATAHAETGCTVTIHVYDPAKEYDKLVGWIWIRGSSSDGGIRGEMSATAADDEPFAKEGNSAHTIDLSFDEAAATRLKNGTQLGFLICLKKASGGSWDDMYDKQGMSDVYVDISGAFDENNHADVYFVRKDIIAFTDVEVAKMALEKITSAKFTSKTEVYFETSSAVKSDAKVSLYSGFDKIGEVTPKLEQGGIKGTAQFASFAFDFTADYTIEIDNFPNATSVSKAAFIDDVEFIKIFENEDTQGLDYGAIYTKDGTLFRLWAPFARDVSVRTYADGSGSGVEREAPMRKRLVNNQWGGVWEITLNGDLNGTYYTYLIDNGGIATETIDPYAKACGVNGARGMVIDFKSADPVGWDRDKHLYSTNPLNADTPIVWEIHIKDFSSSPDSGMRYKGKYLAFTEKNTHVPGKANLKTGISYLQDLGITYVHLNPVYDFATVDEGEPSIADNTKDNFNWGYDPQNYNIPEGSYSTDATRGDVRINEFKQMVMALHNAGIGVIMDVVYNHTYSITGQALNDSVPGYFHRTNEDGKYTEASGCGNETASERTMCRKYIVDSIVHWATEYHIDGFRFDLMGIHDLDTIRAVRDALDKLDGGEGKKLLIYGEPWAADGENVPESYTNRVDVTHSGVTGYALNSSDNVLLKVKFAGYNYQRDMTVLPDRVAVFNDTGRDGLRGNQWDGVPNAGEGWATGTGSYDKGVTSVMEGGCGGAGYGMHTSNGAGNVAYSTAHDNFTLWDHLAGKRNATETPLSYDYVDTNRIQQCKLVSASYMMSTGIVFFLAGDEIARTKYGNENSYATPYKLNMINWSRQSAFVDLYNHYKALISLRKKYSTQLFSYSKSVEKSFCTGTFEGSSGDTLKFTRTKNSTTLTCTLTRSSGWGTTCNGTIRIGTDSYSF